MKEQILINQGYVNFKKLNQKLFGIYYGESPLITVMKWVDMKKAIGTFKTPYNL